MLMEPFEHYCFIVEAATELKLLNKVWGLEGCPLKGQTMRINR